MRDINDLSGQRFGKLTAIAMVGRQNDRVLWLCDCDCGGEKIVSANNLCRGHTKSCGCLTSAHPTHNMTGTRLYRIWRGMKARCSNVKDDKYLNYGARGIIVCSEWETDFEAFRDWALANGYTENLTIDRIDNDGNYCPENCRWTTLKVQENNKRNNRRIEYNGQTHTLTEWSEILNIERHVLSQRLRKGWSIEKAFATPLLKTWSRFKNGSTNDKRNSSIPEKEVS